MRPGANAPIEPWGTRLPVKGILWRQIRRWRCNPTAPRSVLGQGTTHLRWWAPNGLQVPSLKWT